MLFYTLNRNKNAIYFAQSTKKSVDFIFFCKFLQELDDAKHENYEAREEKLQAISRTRLGVKEDIDKLKAKIREVRF